MRSAFWRRKASTPASSNGRWRCLPRALFALVIGALSLRTRGVYFIMITLAFAQMIYYVGVSLDRYGGDDGLTIYKRSEFAGLIDLSNKTVFYYLCFVAAAGTVLSRLAHRQFALRPGDPGRALERAAHARDRLPDLPLSAHLLRDRRRAVRPGRRAARQPHRLRQPGDDALDALRRSDRHGGAGRHGLGVRSGDRRGRVAGARGSCRIDRWSAIHHRQEVVPPRNIGSSSSVRCCCWSCCSRAAASTACWRGSAVADALLSVDGLTKRFGGVLASDDVMLDVAPRRIARHHRPERRRQDHADRPAYRRDRARCRPHRFRRPATSPRCRSIERSALGLARSFQITSLFPDFTALDNVALAVQAHAGHSFRFWRDAREEAELREPARAALDRVGLVAPRR